ncbi:hypothetical protein [Serratia fonticola]
MNGHFLYEFPVELPFLGRSIIYTEEGKIKAVMPLQPDQVVVDMDMMVIILRMAGYIVKRK